MRNRIKSLLEEEFNDLIKYVSFLNREIDRCVESKHIWQDV